MLGALDLLPPALFRTAWIPLTAVGAVSRSHRRVAEVATNVGASKVPAPDPHASAGRRADRGQDRRQCRPATAKGGGCLIINSGTSAVVDSCSVSSLCLRLRLTTRRQGRRRGVR